MNYVCENGMLIKSKENSQSEKFFIEKTQS